MEYHQVHDYRRCILALERFVPGIPYATKSNAPSTLFVKRSQGDIPKPEQ